MTTIKEDYCSQEVYRLLREKGFEGEVHTTFDEEGYTQPSITLQMAMKWLRKVHDLFIQLEVTPWPRKGFFVKIYLYKKQHNDFEEVSYVKYEKSYEQACDEAIKYCLENLI